MTHPQWLIDIIEREKAAIPGPWDNRCLKFSNSEPPINIWSEYGWIARTENISRIETAEFIAHSRTDIPLLVSKLETAIEALGNIGNTLTCASMEAASTDNFESMADAYFDLNRLRRKIANEALRTILEEPK